MFIKLHRLFGKVNCQRRLLNLHEYQCKNILKDNGLTVQKFGVAETPDSAFQIANSIKAKEFVIKAQILAGGRGKGVFNTGFKGGVHLTKEYSFPNICPIKIREIAKKMLGNFLITKQTLPEGVLVKKVTVAEALDIVKETYLAVLLDPCHGTPVIVGSPCGGMDIEDVAKSSPDKIFKESINILTGPKKSQCIKIAKNIGISCEYLEEAADQIMKLYNLMIKIDATQIEINPFGIASNNKVVCFDSKINIDDNAKFKQKELFEMEDTSELPENELEASKSGLTYIQLSGDIGCLVNGAGLAMATLDIVKSHNGSPANFLDLGGTANEIRVVKAMEIFAKDKKVKKIFVNIFGGIVDCRIVANGIVKAKSLYSDFPPIIVRFKGNNAEEAKEILKASENSGITLIDDFETAAIYVSTGQMPKK